MRFVQLASGVDTVPVLLERNRAGRYQGRWNGCEAAVILPNGEEVSPLVELAVLTPDYCLGLERYDETVTFIHCSVFARWGLGLARDIRAAVDRLSASHDRPLFAASDRPHGGDHAKFGKFVRLMGFEYFRTVRGTDGNDHAVFVRRR